MTIPSDPIKESEAIRYDPIKKAAEFKVGDTTISIKAKKTFSVLGKLKQFVNSYNRTGYVPINLKNGDKIHVKVADLASELNISPKKIIDAAKKGNLEQIIDEKIAIDKSFHKFIKFNMEEIVMSPRGVTFPDRDVREERGFNDADLDLIKEIYRLTHLILDNPSLAKSNQELTIKLSSRITLVAKNDGTALKIDLLCGKKLGEGGFGVAFQRINLLEQKFDTSPEAVVKVAAPRGEDEKEKAEADLRNEIKILGKINENSPVLGVQNPLKAISTGQQPVRMHAGPLYQGGDLFTLIMGDSDQGIPEANLTDKQKCSIVYQLLHGLAHMHARNITHGDIKPENTFVEKNPDPNSPVDFMPRIGDFGGALLFDKDLTVSKYKVTFTPEYRVTQDRQAAKDLLREQGESGLGQVKEIEQKADVLAMCKTIFQVLTGGHEPTIEGLYKREPESEINQVEMLGYLSIYFSDETVMLILRGLTGDDRRPTAEQLMDAVLKDISNEYPDLAAELKKLSSPLP